MTRATVVVMVVVVGCDGGEGHLGDGRGGEGGFCDDGVGDSGPKDGGDGGDVKEAFVTVVPVKV